MFAGALLAGVKRPDCVGRWPALALDLGDSHPLLYARSYLADINGVVGYIRVRNQRPFDLFAPRSWWSPIWKKPLETLASMDYPTAQPDYPEAQVEQTGAKTAGPFFRAFGGTWCPYRPQPVSNGMPDARCWPASPDGEWQVQFCWVDDETLFVPGSLALFRKKPE